MLMLSNAEVQEHLSMAECMDALEVAYADLGRGRGATTNRMDLYTRRDPAQYPPLPDKPIGDFAYHQMRILAGSAPCFGVSALRVVSELKTWPVVNGARKQVRYPAAPGQRYVGLVVLFDLNELRPVAVFPDGVIQAMRVAATNGLGVRHLARADSKTALLLGTGWQAEYLARALMVARPLQRIDVYSPNPAHRQAFAQRLGVELGVEIRAVDDPATVASGADIIVAATNATTPVLHANWLSPGVHIGFTRRQEIDLETVRRCDLLVTNGGAESQERVSSFGAGDDVPEPQFRPGWWDDKAVWERMRELGRDVLAGTVRRSSATDRTWFYSTGRGMQFAAAGGRLYQIAVERGLGHTLPDDWFLQTMNS